MLAALFPGQGSQRPRMGAPWRDHPCWAIVEQVSDTTGRDVAELLLGADAATLQQTRNAQLAAYTLSMVIWAAVEQAGWPGLEHPGAFAGHSLGEYSALSAAGALDVETGARLVAARAEAMQLAADTNSGTMAAVLGLEPDEVEAACEPVAEVWLANDNAPGQLVIAGSPTGVAAASQAASERGAKRVLALAVGGAFHSPLMQPAQAHLDAALDQVDFGEAGAPVVTNVDAAAHTGGWGKLLAAQLCSPVRWRPSLLTLADLGVDRFVELGPGTELSGMVRRTVPGAGRFNVATPEDLAKLVQ